MRTALRVGLAGALAALGSPHAGGETPPPKYRMDVVYIFETQLPDAATESILVVGNSGFRSVGALKQFVERLPRGSTLEWAPGCIRFGGELLLSSPAHMEDFAAFCKKKGVSFILHPSG